MSAGVLAASLLFAVTGCGDDDDEADTGDETTDEATDDAADDTGGDEAAFCDALVDLSILFGSPEPPSATEVDPLLEAFESNAPEDLADEATTMRAGAEAALGGDEAAFEDPVFNEASGTVDDFAYDSCEGEKGEVSAVDYEFEGVPESVPAGVSIVRFTNNGTELHEFQLARRNDGVTQSFEEILALEEAEALALVTPVGGTFAEQGDTTYAYADLEPGDYAAICFLPVGATDFAALEGLPEDADAHYEQGMLTEFTVS